jgi:hypothetical protein
MKVPYRTPVEGDLKEEIVGNRHYRYVYRNDEWQSFHSCEIEIEVVKVPACKKSDLSEMEQIKEEMDVLSQQG